MRSFADLLSVGLVVLGAFAGNAVAEACKTINSIAYCRAVDHITYSGIADSGSYDDVVAMDGKSCACDTKPQEYSGVLEPLGGQVGRPSIPSSLSLPPPSPSPIKRRLMEPRSPCTSAVRWP